MVGVCLLALWGFCSPGGVFRFLWFSAPSVLFLFLLLLWAAAAAATTTTRRTRTSCPFPASLTYLSCEWSSWGPSTCPLLATSLGAWRTSRKTCLKTSLSLTLKAACARCRAPSSLFLPPEHGKNIIYMCVLMPSFQKNKVIDKYMKHSKYWRNSIILDSRTGKTLYLGLFIYLFIYIYIIDRGATLYLLRLIIDTGVCPACFLITCLRAPPRKKVVGPRLLRIFFTGVFFLPECAPAASRSWRGGLYDPARGLRSWSKWKMQSKAPQKLLTHTHTHT